MDNLTALETNLKKFADELADVFIYLVRLGKVLEVNLDEPVRGKIEKNAQKHPPELLGHQGY